MAYRFQLLFTLWLCSLIACLITALVLIAIPWALKQLQMIWLVIAVVGFLAAIAAYIAWQSAGETTGLGWFSAYLPWACAYALWLVCYLPVVRRRAIVLAAVGCTLLSLLVAFQQFDWAPLINPVPLLEPNSSTIPLTTA